MGATFSRLRLRKLKYTKINKHKSENRKMQSETEVVAIAVILNGNEESVEEYEQVTITEVLPEPELLNSESDTSENSEEYVDVRVIFDHDILDIIFSKMNLQDLLHTRLVCKFWNEVAVPHLRKNRFSASFSTDGQITQFMELMDNCYHFPYSKFYFYTDFYFISNENLLNFCMKYGTFVLEYEINTFEVIYRYEQEEDVINLELANLLAYSPELNALKMFGRFEVSFKQEAIQHLLKVYSNLEFLEISYMYPTTKINQTEMASLLVSRAPRLKSIKLDFSSGNHGRPYIFTQRRNGEYSHALNKKFLEIVQRLLTKPTISIVTLFSERDYEIVEQLAKIPMNLFKLVARYNIELADTSLQEAFTRAFAIWLTRCENHLKVLHLITQGSQFVRIPPLKNLQKLKIIFTIIRHNSNALVNSLIPIPNQFAQLTTLKLMTYDPRHWETPDGNICVVNSLKCLEICCNLTFSRFPPIWLMFPNMDTLTLYFPEKFHLLVIMRELKQIKHLRIFDMDGDWVWNFLTNHRSAKFSDEELLTFDPAQESPLPIAFLDSFTAIETLEMIGCCKDAVDALIYMSRTQRLRKLKNLCITEGTSHPYLQNVEALQILQEIHHSACFYKANQHYDDKYKWNRYIPIIYLI